MEVPANRVAARPKVRALVAGLLGIDPAELDVDMPFLEMGADSIVMAEAVQAIEAAFSCRLTIRQLFEGLSTVAAVADHLDALAADDVAGGVVIEAAAPVPCESPAASSGVVNANRDKAPAVQSAQPLAAREALPGLLEQQLRIMTQQLDLLRTGRASTPFAHDHNPRPGSAPGVAVEAPTCAPESVNAVPAPAAPSLPTWGIRELRARALSEEQQQHLEALTANYNQRTTGSKQLTQRNRAVLADNRASAGFRFSTKEMLYPIVAERCAGARFHDVDGNEYLDMTMGFGVSLFGHSPAFVSEALQAHLERGFALGPQTGLAGEVATLISDLTGMQRVSFTNSGTEAVMTALRLARAATGRRKVALFCGSYHGHFDATLGALPHGGGAPIPVAAGIAPSMLADTLLLAYDDPQSLATLREHADDLAAVLVEPVQSRRPALQPREFLRELRSLTEEAGIALIFDEMITGFRIHPGGAQADFGVRADLATYGKIVGGGMPIGVVAGTPRFMDALDGGSWEYGDASYPSAETTFFAGTFCKHPLTMAAAKAVLLEIKRCGPALQETLNQRTAALARTLNDYFEAQEVPIRIEHYGSLFRFAFSGNHDLIFYHLLANGIYVWEGRNCFVSTAHTDADLETFISAVQNGVQALRAGGFLPPRSCAAPLEIAAPQEAAQDNVPELVPLSEAQEQLWVLAEVSKQGALAYHVSTCLELRGPVRIDAMRTALNGLAARHGALRTVIEVDGRSQRVLPELQLEMSLLDLRDDPTPEQSLAQWYAKASDTPFDLARGPLWRAQLIRLDTELHQLVVTAHHIIVDGWSMGLMLSDLAHLYDAACHDRPAAAAPVMQFADYLRTMQERRDDSAMAEHGTYWLARLHGRLPGLDLPVDRPRSKLKSYRSARQTLCLDEQLTATLRRFAAEQGCTLFMVLLAVYVTLLHRLTSQDDLIVGIPASGRSLEGSTALVGYCAHLLAIRSELDTTATFAGHLRALRGTLLDAYEHQDYPFARLIKALDLPPDLSQSALVTTTFNLDRPVAMPELFELDASLVSQPIGYAGYDLNLNVIENERSLLVQCDYNADLFEAATVGRLVGHFETLLHGAVADPGQPLMQLPLLSPVQREQMLVDWNATSAPYASEQCVHQLFEARVARDPDAIAIEFEGTCMSYATLNARANQLAHYLRGKGVGPETLVGLCVERSPELIIGLFGILKAGAAYVPLDPTYPAARLAYMLEDTQAPVLLTSAACAEQLPDCEALLLRLDSDWQQVATQAQSNPVTEVTASNLAYVIFTSGSTGKPKGTLIVHRGLVNYLDWCVKAYAVEDGRGTPLHSSIGFDATITSIYPALLSGRTLFVVPEEREVERLASLLETQADLSLVKITPAHLDALSHLLEPDRLAGRTRALVLGGEALSGASVEAWRRHAPGTRLINEYGPTETVVGCCVYEVPAQGSCPASIPIGRPIANTQLYVLDPHAEPVPIGVAGELYIGGAGVARGYLNQPELTARKFVANPFNADPTSRLYKTGDLARYLPDGNLEYLGRIDDQVKIRGFRIELGEIEATLMAHPDVRDVAVVARTEAAGHKRLVAYVVLAVDDAHFADSLRQCLNATLPAHMVPSAFIALRSLPLTTNGKVDRTALPAPADIEPAQARVAPRDSAEELLAGIWSDVLRQPPPGIHDNFFELGGDSILAIQVVGRANEAGLRLAAKDLFARQTIAELAASEDTAPLREAEQGLVTGPVPLTPIQGWFFERKLEQPAHYNQAVLLSVPADVTPVQLELVMQRLLAHHDALRMRFVALDLAWQQSNSAADETPALRVLDLAGMPPARERAAIEAAAAAEQAGLDLANGPLLRALLVQRGPAQDAQLLIVIHHLVVDGVSWRILLHDWQRLLEATRREETVALPAKTTAFKSWAARVRDYARSEELAEERDYWLATARHPVAKLPRDYVLDAKANTVACEDRVSISFSVEQTRALLEDMPRVYHTQVNDVLLTALLRSVSQWTGSDSLLLDLEGHGRESLFCDVDVSRTVGWFTSLFPVCLELAGNDPGEALKSVKEQLRQVPMRGIGYGLLRYAGEDASLQDALRALPQAELSFNYLGQLDQVLDDGPLFAWANGPVGPQSDAANQRAHLLEVDAHVSAGRLHLDWSYSTRVHRNATINSLAKRYKATLLELIEHCESPHTGGYTPSDFPLASLDQQQLAKMSQLLAQH